jgi:hypothetical protein
MRGKLIFVVGAAVGYVVGTRRGRRGYEQLKSQATDLWNNPKVKQTVSDVQQFAKDKLPAVAPLLATAADKAREKVDEVSTDDSATTPDREPNA